MLARPEATEHDPWYANYVRQVPDGDIIRTLSAQVEDIVALLAGVTRERETYRYTAGKWSIREVVGHVIDTERVFASRALWFARQAEGALPSMDQDQWAATSNAAGRPLPDMIAELRAVRAATVALFGTFDGNVGLRRGIASGVPFTVRSIAWIIAGHERHHAALLRSAYGL